MIFRLRRLKRERTTKTKKKREEHDIMIIFLKKKKSLTLKNKPVAWGRYSIGDMYSISCIDVVV